MHARTHARTYHDARYLHNILMTRKCFFILLRSFTDLVSMALDDGIMV